MLLLPYLSDRYTLVSHVITDLPYLKPSVALVVGFVSSKMCLEYFYHDLDLCAVVLTLLCLSAL